MMRTIVTRYAGALSGEPRNQRRFKNLFKPPSPDAPPPMPDPNSPSALEAGRVAAQTAMAGGRSSTVLTNARTRARDTIAGGYNAARTGSQ